jgi:hypothetical protein
MNSKLAIYATVYVITFLRLAFAGLLYIAAIDSKTIAISYILLVISAINIVFAIRKLFSNLTILKKIVAIKE